jgi:hypothetical protein
MKFLNKIDGADKLITDANNRLVTDAQINEWDNKAEASHTHTVDAITGNLETTRLTEPPYVTGNVTITSKPLFDILRADRTAFLPASQIIIEKSIDGGVTWEDAGISDTNKAKLFTGQRPSIAIPRKDGMKNTDCMLRITITGMKYNVPLGTAETAKYNYWNSNYVIATERYFTAEDAWLWVNSNSDRIYCKVERATGGNPNNWITVREAFLSGWAGGNYIKLGGANFGGGTSQTGNNWNWRFIFRTATTSNDFDNAKLRQTYITQSQTIHHIKISGRNVWTSPNNLMYHDHLYTWDEYQNAIFPKELKAKTFKNASGKEVAYQNDIPTKLSQLNKDINFDERYYTESEVDNKLNSKVDKVSGKGLSTEDYTTAEKNKLSGIEAGANKYIHPSTHPASMITESTSRRFVSDAEKASWNNKAEISDIPTKVSQLTNDSGFLTTNDLVPNISIGKSKPTDGSLIWYEEI